MNKPPPFRNDMLIALQSGLTAGINSKRAAICAMSECSRVRAPKPLLTTPYAEADAGSRQASWLINNAPD